jgi:hypothetical protein
MAFQKTLDTTDHGVAVTDAYGTVTSVRSDKNNSRISVEWFASKDARDAGNMSLHTGNYKAPASELASADNPVACAYTWLKTQSDFTGATDV